MRNIAVVLLVALLSTFCLPALGSAQPPSEVTPVASLGSAGGRLGIVGAFAAPDLARQAGARWERINFWWDALQPNAADSWDWTGAPISDALLANDIAAGITPVGLIGNPPAWATRNGSVPKNLDSSVNDPQNYWAQFVSALARRYSGRINYWIVWNEPDINPGQPGSTWGGTEDEYYILLKTASLAAKAVNPAAKIVFAGTTYFADFNVGRQLFLERVLTVARQLDPTGPANGYYFDVVNTHIYAAVHEMENISQKNREVLQRFGLNKPVWRQRI